MSNKAFFFAGGGTGGHIYPAIAVAEKIIEFEPTAKIHFFCSSREIDSKILSKTGFESTKLPAEAFSLHPAKFLRFLKTFFQSAKIADRILDKTENPVVVGIGGFAAAPVCRAAHKRKIPVKLINVDIVPGRANKLIARWADEIFVQFEDSARYLKKQKYKINVTGCPLRAGFENSNPQKAVEHFGLDKNKKTLLITGASSGSQNINNTICSLLEFLDRFAENWQIVHITGVNNLDRVKSKYSSAKIKHKIIDYYDDMADLLSAANLVIGRSGAVSIAEYAAASVPSICIPYPYHRDMHQYLNAGKLVEAGAAIIVDDLPDEKDRREWLAEELEELMNNDNKLAEMKNNCEIIANKNATITITEKLLKI